MISSPATAASSNLDDITASLFYQLRDKNRVFDFDILQCPKCPERLEALELDVYEENGQTYQRIWWTCRGIKTQNCHFPLWVPKEVFWTRRTEEQMRTGYIPLPNIHLLPQRLWYLYPNVFRNELNQDGIGSAKKNHSGTVTPSSGHATRGSSVRPESALTENEECSRDSFLSTPLSSDKTNSYVPNEVEIWESETPIRQIRIDEEDIEEGFELVSNTHGPVISSQSNASDQKDYEWKNSGIKDTAYDSKSWEMSLIPECDVAADLPLHSFTDSFVHFSSEADSSTQQQQEQFREKNSSYEIHPDNDDVILEVLRPANHNTGQDPKGIDCNSEISTKTVRKRKKSAVSEERFDEAACNGTVSGINSSSDRISLVLPSINTKTPESVNIAQIREVFQKQKRQRSNSEVVDDNRVITSLVKELVIRVALELDFIKNKATFAASCTKQTQRHLLKIISLEEAKKDFGDLTLEELLKGVSNLRSSAVAQNCSRKWPESNLQGKNRNLQSAADNPMQQGVGRRAHYCEKSDAKTFTKISTEMTTGSGVQHPVRKRRCGNTDRSTLPRNLPADQKCIAAVEMALKQSVKGIRGQEETITAPRTSILKGSPSKFRPDMISSEIFDPLNWRRPVHFGGRTNLDAFVTAYNLRYNRAEYLDALGSELCKRRIMKFVPSIPVKQQRLVRRMQQKRSGHEDMLDLETLKKAVDPDALRVQIAHRLGIKNLDGIMPCSKVGNYQGDEVSGRMQHIASAPFTSAVSPGACEPDSTEYIQSNENDEQGSELNLSESLYSYPLSEYESKIKTEKGEMKAPFILSFNDPEVDALVHRKFKNYVQEENATEVAILNESLEQQSHTTENHAPSISRIEYVDFESAFEEYENDDVQQFDSYFEFQ